MGSANSIAADSDAGLLSAARLREAFDQAFAEAPRLGGQGLEDYLAIRVGAVRYALRFAELSGLFRDRTVVPVNARAPGLLGVAGFRGRVAPIHDLGPLLGQPSQSNPRWIALGRAENMMGFAFEGFEGHLRLPASETLAAVDDSAKPQIHGLLRGLLRTTDAVRPLIHMPSLVAAIAKGER